MKFEPPPLGAQPREKFEVVGIIGRKAGGDLYAIQVEAGPRGAPAIEVQSRYGYADPEDLTDQFTTRPINLDITVTVTAPNGFRLWVNPPPPPTQAGPPLAIEGSEHGGQAEVG